MHRCIWQFTNQHWMVTLEYKCEAWLWNGDDQLLGQLTLRNDGLHFQPLKFQNSHLNIFIPFSDIKNIEEFLLFNLSRSGLRIESVKGRSDAFIVEESVEVRKEIRRMMDKKMV